ncbi:21729_t:CDS:2 [Entrophospora sp. SA101]|nr:4465_t:CDS:2 [Entrophospora sp. SA101]CAJ0634148.1 11338_t:CDS:2 [Entrophospora sp. SA101]CAJ0756273.1 21729_t:CDS:2 [Entrophospora sp. SA101]
MSSVQLTTIDNFKEFVIESISQNFKEQLSFLDKIPEKEFEKNYFEENIKGQSRNLKRKKLESTPISQEPITSSTSPLPSFTTSQFSPYYETTNNNGNDSNDNSDNNKSTYSIEAISRAKNTIAFFRALNSGCFRNLDPNSFVVISDGKLLGIYPNEDQAEAMIRKVIASRSNFSITNLHHNDENNNDHLLHDLHIQ